MNPEPNSIAAEPKRVSLAKFVGYFLRLGTVGFGGPIALAGHMQQDLVDERGWVRKEDYLEGLALAQLAPGPLAAQLAIYLGYLRAGVLGASAVGVAFVLPSFLMVLGLSAAYVRFGGLPWMQGMFYGIGAAVIGIIARSAFKLTKLTLGKDKLLWGIFAVLAVSTAWASREIIWLFLLGGIVAVVVKALPVRQQARAAVSLLLPAVTVGTNNTLLQLFLYFAKAGMFVFGSGLAVVPFLYGGVVQGHHRLSGRRCCGSNGGSTRNIPSGLPGCCFARALLQTMGEESAVERVRARRHRSGHRRDCRCGDRSCATFCLRSPHDSD